jgi:hypothetical protein
MNRNENHPTSAEKGYGVTALYNRQDWVSSRFAQPQPFLPSESAAASPLPYWKTMRE